MGNIISRQKRPSKFVSICKQFPQILHETDSKSLRSLTRVNKALRKQVETTDVWRNQFAKLMDTTPKALPSPPSAPWPEAKQFQVMCQAVENAKFYASLPASKRMESDFEGLITIGTNEYLSLHFPAQFLMLEELVSDLEMISKLKNLPPDFWTQIAKHSACAGLSTTGATTSIISILKLKAGLGLLQSAGILGKPALRIFLGVSFGLSGTAAVVATTVSVAMIGKSLYDARMWRLDRAELIVGLKAASRASEAQREVPAVDKLKV